MTNKAVLLGLDIGARRIGVALADSIGRLAQPLATVIVDGDELERLQDICVQHDVTTLVVGLPRNMSGAETAQTATVREVARTQLARLNLPMKFQDESVTSVIAEEQLAKRKKPYTKADIDAMAAAIILQDYLEEQHG